VPPPASNHCPRRARGSCGDLRGTRRAGNVHGILREVSFDTPSGSRDASGADASASAGRILLVDDDDLLLRAVSRVLTRAHYEVSTFRSAPDALAALQRAGGAADLVISDLHMPGMDGLELLERVRANWPDLPVMVLSGDPSVASSVEALRRGAYDYLTKPLEAYEEVVLAVRRAVERRRLVERNRALERQIAVSDRFKGIVGTTPAMRELFGLVESVAPTDATVLLLGESGTGKEMLARAIHERSARAGGPFVPINCSALTDTLLESELFGHVRGAFTGASTSRIGVFEEASRGTLFLDEIGDISAAMQVRLLRALQEGEIKPVGSTEIRKVDVRVVAATNRDLEAAARAGNFRQDLYYRLNVVPLELPPLRQRPEDIPLLVHHFLLRYAAKFGKPVSRLAPEALEALQSYQWPGNVRELENVVQRAVVLASGDVVTPALLPTSVRQDRAGAEPVRRFDLPFAQAKQAAVEEFERQYLEEALRRSGGRIAEAARLSGLDKSNFRRLVRRHHLSRRPLGGGGPE
jgi:DNA-binding NtrC family response regulator